MWWIMLAIFGFVSLIGLVGFTDLREGRTMFAAIMFGAYFFVFLAAIICKYGHQNIGLAIGIAAAYGAFEFCARATNLDVDSYFFEKILQESYRMDEEKKRTASQSN